MRSISANRPLWAQSGALTPEQIEQAIALGLEADPKPHILRSPVTRTSPRSYNFALVFTPVLRVQFFARHAWVNDGRLLTPADIPSDLLAPVVHVATWAG